jgi:hypothetical protein
MCLLAHNFNVKMSLSSSPIFKINIYVRSVAISGMIILKWTSGKYGV